MFQEAVPGLQEGAGLPGHLGGHRDHGGPRPVRQGSQGCPYLHTYPLRTTFEMSLSLFILSKKKSKTMPTPC